MVNHEFALLKPKQSLQRVYYRYRYSKKTTYDKKVTHGKKKIGNNGKNFMTGCFALGICFIGMSSRD